VSGAASLAQMVIDYELCKNLEQLARGFPVDAEHIQIDLIKRVGIGGSFLAEPESVRYMRETLYVPRLFDRSPAGGWSSERGMLPRAKKRVREILDNDRGPHYLQPEQTEELERIAARAAAALG
jgi:trimethylamine:corrinoid methyltransferase-like protein